MKAETLPGAICGRLYHLGISFRTRGHDDAVNRTGGDTQLTPCALFGQDSMHGLGGADDGVYRASLDTQRATDAIRLYDQGHGAGLVRAMHWVQRLAGKPKQLSQLANAFFSTRWTLIDIRLACRNRHCVRFATRITALRALRLRQQGIDSGNAGIAG